MEDERRLKKSMGRYLAAVVCLSLLSGCLYSPRKSKEIAITLPEPYVADVQILYSELTLQGKMERLAGDGLRLFVDSPKNLSGLRLQLQNGELQASYGELAFCVDNTVLPADSALALLRDALRSVNGETLALGKASSGQALQLTNEHGRLEVLLDEERFLPRQIHIPELGFTAKLELPEAAFAG